MDLSAGNVETALRSYFTRLFNKNVQSKWREAIDYKALADIVLIAAVSPPVEEPSRVDYDALDEDEARQHRRLIYMQLDEDDRWVVCRLANEGKLLPGEIQISYVAVSHLQELGVIDSECQLTHLGHAIAIGVLRRKN